MKSAKAASGDASSSRRSQPVRQTRTNPPRVSSGLRGPANGRDSLAGGTASDQPIDIYPAITYFSDAIAALPKELVRHFTLLKEVDAKIFAPKMRSSSSSTLP
ncbi:chromatin modification-related protein [Colletotrichum higginsianum]|nr:chromatin modification-related protein [Colletotrichum higginsianum]